MMSTTNWRTISGRSVAARDENGHRAGGAGYAAAGIGSLRTGRGTS
jgi:hypothetical protein